MGRSLFFLVACWAVSLVALAAPPDTLRLWPGPAPGALGTAPEDVPSVTVYRPEAPNGTAVVVCPGGGYGHLALGHEGEDVAAWLNGLGVTAFVLTYRLGPRYQHPAMVQDVQRALRTVRAHADAYDVAPDRIGVLGFSAGGHLAATAAVHYDLDVPTVGDAVDAVSARPDFAVLVYPVIALGQPFTHQGSQRNLLGEAPDPALVAQMSAETQVTPETPPTFLVHTTEDQAVPVENSLVFYAALREAGVPGELHVYERGRHGLGLAPDAPGLSSWPERCADWLGLHGFLP